jgi:phosphoglycerate kinase
VKTVREIPVLHNIPVLVRASLNVPVKDGVAENSFRLKQALPTINFLTERGARVILISHIDPPVLAGGTPRTGTETLAPVFEVLKKVISNATFCEHVIGPEARKAVRDLLPGHVLVLENLRRHGGEVGNDPAFARELSMLADVFVEDCFDTCHRPHASIIGVPTILPSYAGLLLEREIEALTKALTPTKPSLAIVGGAKFSTKQAVLEKLLTRYDNVFVGGALANDFLRAKGEDVGKSVVSETPQGILENLLRNPRLLIPLDSRIQDERIEDHGPETAKMLMGYVEKAKTVLWNGPLGEYEKGFTETTDVLARAIAESKAYSVVGGGDTVAEIERIGLLNRFSFVSTGGGAMLEFLAKGTLPGIQALG